MNVNIAKAYLKRENGVLYIKQKGNAKNRIDNVVITIDNNNTLTLIYTDFNFRWNEQRPDWNWNDVTDFFPYKSTYDITEVLPEYIEDKKYSYTKGFWKKQKIESSRPIVKNGEVRLNKPAQRVMVKCNTNWDIEVLRDNIEGNLYEAKEIYKNNA